MTGKGRTRAEPVGGHQAILEEVLTVEEIITRYRDRWVLMRVTGHDEDHWPAKGYVIATAATQREADAVLESMIEAKPKPRRDGCPLYAFWAQPDIGPAEFNALLQELLSSAKASA